MIRRRTYLFVAVAILCVLHLYACGDNSKQIVGKWQQDQPVENANFSLTFDGVEEYKADGTLSYIGMISMYEKPTKTTRALDVVWQGTWNVKGSTLTQQWQTRQTKTMTVNKSEKYSGATIPSGWDLSQQMQPTQIRTIKKLDKQQMVLEEKAQYQNYEYHYTRTL